MNVDTGSALLSRQAGFRNETAALRSQLAQAKREAVSGRLSDPVVDLGSRNGERISLAQSATRLDGVQDANSIVAGRLGAVQAASQFFADAAGDGLTTFISAASGSVAPGQLEAAAAKTAETMQSALNSTFSGQFVLSGTATTTPPVDAFDGALAELENLFVAHFGFASDDPAARSIGIPDIELFLSTVAQPAATGGIWDTEIANTDGEVATARIAPGERIAISAHANDAAFREGLGAVLLVQHLAKADLASGTLNAVAGFAAEQLAQSAAGVADLQSRTGLQQERVEQTNDRLAAFSDRLRESSDDMVSVDAFEAAARFNALLTQLETAYALTGRFQDLSVMRFIT